MKRETYETIFIPEELDAAVKKGIQKGKQLKRGKRIKRVFTGIGSLAAVFALFITLCATNSTFASYIPFVDKIFDKVEEQADFKGDYSERSTHLSETIQMEQEQHEQVSEKDMVNNKNSDALEQLEELYGATDQNITITPEEVFCDGASLYLGLRLTMLDGNSWGMESADERERAYGTQLIGTCNVDGRDLSFSNWLTVSATKSANVIVGMIKLPADGVTDKTQSINVQIETLCWNDYNVRKAAIGTAEEGKREWYHVLPGKWSLNVPVTIDTSLIQTFSINESNEQGYGISDIKITPYEIQVKAIKPAEDEAEFLGAFAVFNEKGEAFAYGEGSDGYDCYIVDGKSTEQLYFYYFRDEIEAFKCKDQLAAKENSIYQYEISC